MTSEFPAHFACNYQCLLNRLKLHGMQPKTIALYSHGVRRAGVYFDYRIDDLTRLQLTDYFVHIVNSLSLELAQTRPVRTEVLLHPSIK